LAVGFAVSAVWFDVCKRINFSHLCTVSFHHMHAVQGKFF
jgi:hypothetical protein